MPNIAFLIDRDDKRGHVTGSRKLVKSVQETAPISLFWAPTSVPRFEYVLWLACLKAIVDLPVKMKGTSKRSSGLSLCFAAPVTNRDFNIMYVTQANNVSSHVFSFTETKSSGRNKKNLVYLRKFSLNGSIAVRVVIHPNLSTTATLGTGSGVDRKSVV